MDHDYPLYQIDQLLPLASQRLRELGLPDTAQHRYRILPKIRQTQLRSLPHERPHQSDHSTDTRDCPE